MPFVRVCAVAELSPGEVRRVEAGPEPVALCNVGGSFHAVDDTCTHSSWSLADGELEDEVLVCPLHQARFSARTGAVLGPPAPEPLKVYPVKVEGGDVWVDVDAGRLEGE